VATEETREAAVIDLTVDDAADPTPDAPRDGDDLTVEVAPPRDPRPRRNIAWLAGALAVIVATIAIVAFVAARGDSDAPRVATANGDARSDADDGDTDVNDTSVTSSPVSPTSAAASDAPQPTVPVPQLPPESGPSAVLPGAPPPVITAPPPAAGTTVPAPKTSPVSVLRWSASPASLTVRSGESATVVVTVHNPSDGAVTLPLPLSCNPTIDGSGVCPQVTDTVAPRAQRAQMYVVDATNVAPGNYALLVEGGLFSIPVSVTPAA
jgi:hypothetical protein